ncbi:C10 family peptidase [Algicola sagamiensis]|uniref:C10 family peptidase n=1 Tax=Algicola sagamiensis TaxID=163869 RepID=UPI000A04A4C4|nr:C10 family peptidase [Algicola sagamiensis]
MVTTQWSQNGFYDDATPNQQLTGCVATALAQFLRYHAYPEQGVGQNTYQYPDQDQITVDYANAQYQWHQMPDQLTQSNQQVAQLMYHAGTAVNTKYGSQVSLAPMRYLPNALEKHFDYVTNGFEYVRDYLPEQWQNLILDELKQNRIVLLTGHSADQRIGHAWVVDGYDGQGYYHMNWGWGGRMNGYFRLTEPNPRPDYNFNQQMAMVRGAPAQDLQHIPFCQGNQYFTQDQGQITDGSQNWNYRVNSQCKFVIQPQSGAQQITLDFTEFNTEHGYDFVTVYDGNTQIGQWSGSSLPQSVTATSGQMTIQFETDEVVTKGGFQAQYYVR